MGPGSREQGPRTEPVVVPSPDEFVGHLQDGDVLLFDKLSSLNRLVQWADNRPAGHVGVWHAGGVYEATIKLAPGGGSRGGVFLTPFAELMALKVADNRGEVALVRTVTALRHRGMTTQARGLIHEYLTRCTEAEFGVLDMVLLTPFALERSNVAGGESGPEVTQRLIQACAYYAKKRSLAGQKQEKVFCSQLVYRAFQQAGLPVDIPDTLYSRYHFRRHFPLFQSGPGDDKGGGVSPEDNEMTALLGDYQQVFEQEVMSEMTGIEVEEQPDSEADNIAPLTGFTLRRGDSDADRPRSSSPAPRAPELGDMVTPGDFWSSPSFEPIAILHRPAGA